MKNIILKGTIRIGRNLKIYERNANSWKLSRKRMLEALEVAGLFKNYGRFKELVDKNDDKFLKGQLSPQGLVRGARINILPNGQKLDKAYSLLARHLTIHDESSNEHWDVIYQNPNGKYAYLYTIKKKERARNRKYKTVHEFDRVYHKLIINVTKGLKKMDDKLAVPMYTLIKTLMRVGNETYYRAHGHKGLTTLKKSDIRIKRNLVNFSYLAKNGVPMIIEQAFPKEYVERLRKILSEIKNSEFLFRNHNGSTLNDKQFMKAFKKYCGREFYPHIVRSHYATKEVENFIKKHRKADKKEVNGLFNKIAERLGHKKYSKKEGEWKDNPSMTINYYVEPRLVKKIMSIVK